MKLSAQIKSIFLFTILLMVLMFAQSPTEQFNLNSATREQLETLPLTVSQVDAISYYLANRGYFTTIYDLTNCGCISAEDIHNIKSYVFVAEPELSEFIAGQRTASYKVEQWLAAEGNTEGLSEVWLDRYYEPRDINNMNYDDLLSLPNLSPIDVVAVLKQKKRGRIKGTFELRNSPGISYYGYKNLIDFIRFKTDNTAKPEFHLRLSNLIRTVPVTTNPDDEGNITAFSDASRPEMFRKFSLTYGEHIKAGYVYHQNMGDPSGIYSEKRSLTFENIQIWDKFRLDRLVLGNFTACFGQSVVMETSDYFSPRRSGYRFSKQAKGIYPDLTRSTQYVMDGFAVQVSNDYFRGTFFSSLHPRDAILGPDIYTSDTLMVDTTSVIAVDTLGTFTSLIVMQPRLPWGANGFSDSTRLYGPLTSSVEELTWGGNIRFTPVIGANIGFTFYESLYDRVLDPRVVEVITGSPEDENPLFDTGGDTDDYDEYSGDAFYLNYMTNSADPEIEAMYSSIGKSDLWDEAQSYRRVVGFDFAFIYNNIALQGEYGELSSDNKIYKLGNEPGALVLNAFTQFDNFNFLAVYRDYDLEFDNPYQRSFSNYQRFKTTIFEDSYWLEDPIFSYLYSGNPQPQSERGIFLSSRYQFHRSFVGTLNWDNWTRVADEAKYFRTVVTIDWRPVFNYRINIRQKWQARGDYDIDHPSPFQSRETSIRARLRLSKFDAVELLYSNGYTTFSPRPRLTGNALGGYDMTVGDVGTPDESIGVTFTHNFDDHLTVKGGTILIKGFLWYFEDTDFRIFNSEPGAFHHWLAFKFRPSANFAVRFKVSQTVDNPFTRITEGQTSEGNWISNPVVTKETTDFRIQLDYGI